MEDPVGARILGCQSLHDFQILVSLTDAKPCARSFFSFLHRPKQGNELKAFALAKQVKWSLRNTAGSLLLLRQACLSLSTPCQNGFKQKVIGKEKDPPNLKVDTISIQNKRKLKSYTVEFFSSKFLSAPLRFELTTPRFEV